jgi:hypothetical protein
MEYKSVLVQGPMQIPDFTDLIDAAANRMGADGWHLISHSEHRWVDNSGWSVKSGMEALLIFGRESK